MKLNNVYEMIINGERGYGVQYDDKYFYVHEIGTNKIIEMLCDYILEQNKEK